ncbi:uncharacterized protein LOC120902035 [Anopheles arabiensis]|uniref:Uncharacterized protein n=1 Tax=Anopheles gambiae TaxID=7165 RepID=A0A1S4H810_ANOGA|nr:uncharacterized protein LOC120902035 [Anopheles arabiensis]
MLDEAVSVQSYKMDVTCPERCSVVRGAWKGRSNLVRRMNLLVIISVLCCSQFGASYVIVDRDRDSSNTDPQLVGLGSYADHGVPPAHSSAGILSNVPIDPYAKKLLQLYYLVQVMRSYHRPAYQEPTTILSNLIDRLTKEDLRDELERLLSGVDGFEEVFNIGEYAARDPIKEQLANDFRLLFPLVVKTLTGLRESGHMGNDVTAMEDTLQGKLRDAFNDFRGLLVRVVQSESEVLNEIEELQETTYNKPSGVNDVNWNADERRSETVPSAVEIVYVTEQPVASDKAVVNDYDLEVESAAASTERARVELKTDPAIDIRMQNGNDLTFLPDGRSVKYELSSGPNLLSQEPDSDEDEDDETEVIILTEDANMQHNANGNDKGSSSSPMAVMVKDPEMAALIPHIVEQLRLENVTPEERDALAEIFDDLWPLMVAEADRLRTEP